MYRYMLNKIKLITSKLLSFKNYYSCYYSTNKLLLHLYILQFALHRRFLLLNSEGSISLNRLPIFYGTKQCSSFNKYNRTYLSWFFFINNIIQF